MLTLFNRICSWLMFIGGLGVIAMMLGQHARTTSVGFVLGWLVGIVAATTIFLVVGGALDERSSSSGWVKLVLGVILLLARAPVAAITQSAGW